MMLLLFVLWMICIPFAGIYGATWICLLVFGGWRSVNFINAAMDGPTQLPEGYGWVHAEPPDELPMSADTEYFRTHKVYNPNDITTFPSDQ